jgi:hypothetical protein
MTDVPRSVLDGDRLLVDGAPFLVLGAELHNSSGVVPELLEERMSRVAELGANTVLAPVCWDLVEDQEGEFDFATVDLLLVSARRNGLRVVVLWFGAWKNGLSSYAPAWVKRDPARFPLVKDASGQYLPILSAFAPETVAADARAFGRLMEHLAHVDGETGTVIMVQVENEVGILGSARDHSAVAEAAFHSPIPQELLTVAHRFEPGDLPEPLRAALLTAGSGGEGWSDLPPSPAVDELFQATGYAAFLGQVAAHGKQHHAVPMFANAWLPASGDAGIASGGEEPGDYPSGGPLPHVFPAWRSLAPSIDFLAPDIYAPEFAQWCERYRRPGNPLFVPEMSRGTMAAANVAVAIAEYSAIGVSPFGADAIGEAFPEPARRSLQGIYRALGAMASLLPDAQARDRVAGFRLSDGQSSSVDWGDVSMHIRPDMPDATVAERPGSWGVLLEEADGAILGVGDGFQVEFRHRDDARRWAVLRAEALRPAGSGLELTQVLNGDETLSGQVLRFPYRSHVPGAMFGDTERNDDLRRCHLYDYPAR